MKNIWAQVTFVSVKAKGICKDLGSSNKNMVFHLWRGLQPVKFIQKRGESLCGMGLTDASFPLFEYVYVAGLYNFDQNPSVANDFPNEKLAEIYEDLWKKIIYIKINDEVAQDW